MLLFLFSLIKIVIFINIYYVGIIPKSESYEHMKDNIEIFDFTLNAEDIDKIAKLDKGLHLCWNPEKVA